MSYLDRSVPVPAREKPQGVTVILPEEASSFCALLVTDLMRAATDLISSAEYDVVVAPLSDCAIDDPAFWRSRLVVFLGGIERRWQTERRLWLRAQQIMSLSRKTILVGGAVFLATGSVFQTRCKFAIHPNFGLAAAEEGLQAPGAGGLYVPGPRVQSAISPLAAIQLLLEDIGQSHGEFAAASLAAYVGLDSGSEQMRSPKALDIRRRSGGDRVVAGCLDLMEDHLEAPLAIHEIAERLHVSCRQLQRRFMAVLGETPLGIYRVLRVEKAHELLSRTSLPLAEIALITGFESLSNLTRCFKRVYLLTPRDLRLQACRLQSA